MGSSDYVGVVMRYDSSAEEIQQLQEETIAENRKSLDELGAKRPWGREELLALADLEMHFDTRLHSCTFPMYVSTDPFVREVAAAAEVAIDSYGVEVGQREDIYLAVKELNERNDRGEVELESEEKRWVEKLLREFRRSGLELPEDKRKRLAWVKKRIFELCTEFSKNLNEDVTVEVFSVDELAGMPEAWLSSLEKTSDGKFCVTLKHPDVYSLMQKCKVAETRRRMDFLKGAMCQDQNVPLFDEVLELRREVASLLGYETYADFALENRMEKNKENVFSFLSELKEKLMPYAKEEMARFLELKEKDCKETGAEFDGVINSWDMMYYHSMLVDTEYNYDQAKVADYFPLDVVTEGMHRIYQTILGVRFEKLENFEGKWHDGVELYAVYDRDSGNFLGQFFLDMFPRDGKYGHAAVFSLQRAGDTRDGKRQLPCCAMLCNFTPPTKDRPSLLKHREVETYFHEFGHVMHNICTEAKLYTFSCTRVERDFVEAPSQMLENWCYHKEPLGMMSKHYVNDEPLPDDMLEAIVRTKNVNTGLINLRQIFFGTFDMICHTESKKIDTEKLWSDLRLKISLIPQQPGCNPTAGFAHLMGGYEAGYYGYLWSEVYSADLFTAFDGKLMDPHVGMRYRKLILAPGGSKDGKDMVRDFLDREPDQNAFLEHIGVISA